MAVLEIIDAGLMPYAQALALQTELCLKRQQEQIPNTVIITEHPPVITLGARKTENKLRAPAEDIRSCNIELVQVGRGGGTTAHNPGQMVLYPVIKLKTLRLDITGYIRSLESIGIDLLEGLGVSCCRRKGFPGLWVGEKKIASVGVQIKKWVSFHGMAININNDLNIFDWIVPCGLDAVEMTSVYKETGTLSDMAAVKNKLADLCRTYWT
ncbi:MAG TPA: lipoyl(octanoyl) transferase LipB [Anaerohalosphaeraceae bacterium]|nr:lipoyl(octanoyl) transferase LipB [Phycisphaerae bacterium]HOK96356.1 lipoyl(octanoyl) transferase LipB [Anaerohalosphaeraceae bacterium]HOL32047.1 lipoyl(octanoyl) transferase LipB [Anaerohalosphaeraceae bacterium]HOM76269.1 lipoyl(octanoyl) transferase LipB [Anaerohalosphaeraceae bacterium]HPC64316.1 lipoyl(octanoyl) transferase LipB [Anaerohalosphaeraceae bacterium]